MADHDRDHPRPLMPRKKAFLGYWVRRGALIAVLPKIQRMRCIRWVGATLGPEAQASVIRDIRRSQEDGGRSAGPYPKRQRGGACAALGCRPLPARGRAHRLGDAARAGQRPQRDVPGAACAPQFHGPGPERPPRWRRQGGAAGRHDRLVHGGIIRETDSIRVHGGGVSGGPPSIGVQPDLEAGPLYVFQDQVGLASDTDMTCQLLVSVSQPLPTVLCRNSFLTQVRPHRLSCKACAKYLLPVLHCT